jgi:hypothetical protein
MASKDLLIPAERIEQAILLIRGEKAMLDRDLAKLYRVSTGTLNQAVKRNLKRFPPDFMFQLSWDEAARLQAARSRSQTVILKRGSNVKYRPYAFTEHGVAMLSSVLRSQRAIDVNIEIVRTFVRLRQLLASHADLARKLTELEKSYDAKFQVVFEAIRQLMAPPEPERGKFGVHPPEQK